MREDDPSAGVVRPRVRAGVPRPLEPDLVRRAVMAAPLRQRAMLTLAAFAGLRCMEIAQLRWRDVTSDPPVLIVRGKGSRVRPVPASVSVTRVLEDVRVDELLGHRVFVFPRLDGRPGPVAAHLVSRYGAGALRAAGVEATMHDGGFDGLVGFDVECGVRIEERRAGSANVTPPAWTSTVSWSGC